MNKAARLISVIIFSLLFMLSSRATDSEILDYTVSTYFPSETTVFHTPLITDNDTATRTTLLSGCMLELSCEDDIGYVYVKFAGKPVPYTLEFHNTVTGETVTVQKSGDFMHDLTEIPADMHEIIKSENYSSNKTNVTYIGLHSDVDMPIADITLYSTGTLPTDVQRWEMPYSECDILCFPTHADDDTLFMGGLISKYVNQGKLVQVAFICNFDNDFERRHELLNGLWSMGVKAYPILGHFPDLYSRSLRYAKTQYDTEDMLGFITECIRRTKPSVVVGHDLDGEYGHGAHMLSASLVCKAVNTTGNSQMYPESAEKYGVHTAKKTILHLYKENPFIIDVFTPVTSDGLTPFELAEKGYACHLSQHKWNFEVTVDDPDADLSSFGIYRSEVGYDTTDGDILLGISPVIPEISVISEILPSNISQKNPTDLPTAHITDEFESSGVASIPDSLETSVIICLVLAALLILAGFITVRRR